MSDVPVTPTTVLDAAIDAGVPLYKGVLDARTNAITLIQALGLDPSMSVERLRADLEIAARARALAVKSYFAADEYPIAEALCTGWNDCRSAVLGETP